MKDKKITSYLTSEEYELLTVWAETENRPLSEIVRKMILTVMNPEVKK